jgi:hypothetical protein
MLKAAALGIALSTLVLSGCNRSHDYQAEKTWRCVVKHGLLATLESGPETNMTRGIDATLSFQRPLSFQRQLGAAPRQTVASGGFAFAQEGEDPEDVRTRLIKTRELSLRGESSGMTFGKTRRNVIPWWSDTVDAKFRSSAENCLR